MKLKTYLFVVTILAAAALMVGCPPKRDFRTVQQVNKVDDLEELMWFLATVADPGFKAANNEPAAIGDAEFTRFADMGRRVPWAAARLQDKAFSKGPGFDELSGKLGATAGQLAEAAKVRDAKASIGAARAMKQVCADCHSKYR